MGRELINETIKYLLNKVGIEHRVTSAYHPNTNGQTERFNLTLISALRKHCEAHPSDLYKWIPYVLMSYRTRIHSTTGYSPFFLMFGREMLTFQNWSEES
jgi:transposase InsO family protein